MEFSLVLYGAGSALAGLLLWLAVERDGDDPGPDRVIAHLDGDFAVGCGECTRHVGERDVLLQERRRRSAGHVPDRVAAGRKDAVAVARDAPLDHLKADQFALGSARSL